MIFENSSKLSNFFPFVHFLKRYDEISIKIQTPPPLPFRFCKELPISFTMRNKVFYFLTYDTLKIKAFSSQKSLVTSYIAATMIFFKNRYCYNQHICFHYALHNLDRLSVICNRTYEFVCS